MPIHIIPPAVDFSALCLELTPDGGLRYWPAPLQAVCRANGIDPAIIANEDEAMRIVSEWYVLHREFGKPADSAAETIIALLNARMG